MQVDVQNSSIGFVEPFFYSKDRNALLQTLIDGTEDKVYYSLIQTDNEIEYALKINDKKKINHLLSKFDHFAKRIQNTPHLNSSSRITNLITRNNLRFIEYDHLRSLKAWKEIEDKLNYYSYFSHKKPKTNRLVQASDDIQYDSNIHSFEIEEKMREFMNQCIANKSLKFESFFKVSSINTLISCHYKLINQLHPFQIGAILDWETAIYIQENTLFELIKMDFEQNKTSFGSRNIHLKLTLDQLSTLYQESDSNGLLSSNKTFLETLLDKSIPKLLMRYTSYTELNSESPQIYKQQFYNIILYFIKKHLTLPNGHQAHKSVLLYYLLSEQYGIHGTIDINLFIEYLRIPKRTNYNKIMWKYYDQYSNRYNKQQRMLTYHKTRKYRTNQNEEGEDDDEGTLLQQIKYIGSELTISSFFSDATFGPISTKDDMQLIQDALRYFFMNPDAISNVLSEELTQAIKEDTVTFNALKSEYKENKENEEKELEFVDCESYLVLKHFIPYISHDILLSEQCEFELSTGNNTTYSASYTNLMKLKSSAYVQELKNKVMIEYDTFKNKKDYNVEDDIVLNVKVKNVRSLLLKVFKMQTTPYYKKNKSEVASDINLEGLSSKTLDKEISIEMKSEFEVQNLEIPLKSIGGERGLYFVDIIGNGQHSRALIRNGDLKFIQKRTARGHILKLLDENHNVLCDGNVWIDVDDKTYDADANDDSNICIPYSSINNAKSRKVVSAATSMKGYSVLGELQVKNTKYRLETSFYLDRECLLEKQECFLIIKCQLFVNNTHVSLQLLQSVDLDVSITSMDGNLIDKKFKDIQLSDAQDAVIQFMLPINTESIGLKLKCKCKTMDGSFDEFTKTKQFNINGINRTKGIATAHLIPFDNSFIVYILGKNGEPLKDVLCTLNLQHFQLESSFNVSAQSDRYGRIILPHDMDGIQSLSITCADHTEYFTFPLHRCLSPNKINIHENERFVIPYFSANNIMNDKDITLKLYDTKYAKDYTAKIEYHNGCFECKGLSAGTYVLYGDYTAYQCKINVIKSDKIIKMPHTDYAIEDAFETFSSLSNHVPLQITNITDDIRIKVNGGNTSNVRIHALLSHKYPSFPVFNSLKEIPYATPEIYIFNRAPTLYTKQRTISEEYKYVLDRVSAHKYVGNMFPTPSLLLRPWSSRTTKTETKDAAKGDKIEHKTYKKRMRCLQETKLVFHSGEKAKESGSYSSLEFLSKSPSKLLTNLKCDVDGYVMIDKSLLNQNHTFITVIASDNQTWSIRTKTLQQHHATTAIEEKMYDGMDVPSFKYSDIRLFPGLDINKHFAQQREIQLLYSKDESFKITNYKNSQYEIYITLHDIYNLYLLLTKNTTLEEFSFLLHWNELTEKEKQIKVNRYLCHETNFYLYCKHRTFFDDIIKPFIQNKLEKTFMDYWLLNDLDALFKYSSFGRFNQLNAAEQVLLGFAFKNDSKRNDITKEILNYFKEKNKSQKISPSQLQTLFKTVLSDDDEGKDDSKPSKISPTKQTKSLLLNIVKQKGAVPPHYFGYLVDEPRRYSIAAFDDTPAHSPAYSPPPDILLSVRNRAPSICAINMRKKSLDIDELSMSSGSVCDDADYFSMASVMNFKRSISLDHMIHSSDDDVQEAAFDTDLRNLLGLRNADGDGDDEDGMMGMRHKAMDRSYFKQLENTREYQECNYFHIAWDAPTKTLVRINKFWCDFAEYLLDDTVEDKKPKAFLSKYFWLTTGSFTEMVFALSVLDLPVLFKDDDRNKMILKEMNDNDEMMIYCKSACIIFSKQLKETLISTSSTIHCDIHYFDPYNKNKSKQYLNADTDTFEPTQIYGVRVIITNSSSETTNVELLYQIPTGSISVENLGLNTITDFITVNSYSGRNFEFYFYFPAPGTYKQFAIQVSDEKGNILSHCKTSRMVVEYRKPLEDSNIDYESWDQVSVSGKNEDVIHYLQKHNLYDTDLTRIYWRLNDKAFFKIITKYLRSMRFYDDVIWKYALKHRTLTEFKEMIERESLFESCFKPSFYSKWFQFDEVELNDDFCRFSYLEYYPLINARTHPLGQTLSINNEQFKNQYEKFLKYSTFKGINVLHLPMNILLQSVYYLLLQNRISESTELFKLIDEKEATDAYGVQYDYMKAYLSIYDDKDVKCSVARDIVTKYKKVHHLTSFKQRFIDDIKCQLDELQFDDDDDDVEDEEINENNEDTKYDESDDIKTDKQKLQKLLSASIDFEINENGKLVFKYNKIREIEIKFYKMEIELLFSMSPFLSVENNDIFTYIEANESMTVTLPENENEFGVSFPKSLEHQNMYIAVNNHLNLFRSKAFYDNQLIVEIKDRFGLLRVLDRKHLRNIQKAYVKVYALVNGAPKFHKDGYTDRRGQFDYISVSCNHLTSTTKFAILIKTEKYGSMVKTVLIPQQKSYVFDEPQTRTFAKRKIKK